MGWWPQEAPARQPLPSPSLPTPLRLLSSPSHPCPHFPPPVVRLCRRVQEPHTPTPHPRLSPGADPDPRSPPSARAPGNCGRTTVGGAVPPGAAHADTPEIPAPHSWPVQPAGLPSRWSCRRGWCGPQGRSPPGPGAQEACVAGGGSPRCPRTRAQPRGPSPTPAARAQSLWPEPNTPTA